MSGEHSSRPRSTKASRRKTAAAPSVPEQQPASSASDNIVQTEPTAVAGPLPFKMSLRIRGLFIHGRTTSPVTRLHAARDDGRSWTLDCGIIHPAQGVGDEWAASAVLPVDLFAGPASTIRIQAEGSGDQICSFAVGPNCFVGAVESFSNGVLTGWFSTLTADVASEASILQLTVDGRPVHAPFSWIQRPDLAPFGFEPRPHGFRFELPRQVFDGREHVLGVIVNGHALAGECRYRANIIGNIDRFDGSKITGWVQDRGNGIDPRLFEIQAQSGLRIPLNATHERRDVFERGGALNCGFDLTLPRRIDPQLDGLSIVHPQLQDPIVFGPEAFLDQRSHIAVARRVHRAIESGHAVSASDRMWLSLTLKELIPELRRGDRRFTHVHKHPRRPKFETHQVQARRVSIIVPVYSGYDDTITCLKSLARAMIRSANANVLVVDDRGDSRLSEALPALCQTHGFRLLVNPRNLGFVVSVNRGILACPDDHVLLLNSDTIVPDGFLDRMLVHLADPVVASVTPFSNNATILSYPRMNVECPPPRPEEVDRIDRLFAAANTKTSVEIPTAIGFCMLMRREAIDRVGLFDLVWGKGYCEENDWCVRASDAGYVHLAACDVFVAHVGGSSFGPSRMRHIDHNMKILTQRYPDYLPDVMDFIHRDPLATARRHVDLRALVEDPRRKILLVSIALGGGIERHVSDEADRLRSMGYYPMILRASHADRFKLEREVTIELEEGRRVAIRIDDLRAIFTKEIVPLVDELHLHTSVGIPVEVLDILREVGIRKVLTLHDYAMVCPRVTLLTYNDTYCGMPDSKVCDRCVRHLGAHSGLPGFLEKFSSVEDWRTYSRNIVSQFDVVQAPSDDLAKRIGPALMRDVAVHPPAEQLTYHAYSPSDLAPKRKDRLAVAVVGAIGEHKGLKALKGLAFDIAARNLPIDIKIIGYTSDDRFFNEFEFVSISGSYDTAKAVEAIQAAGADCALFLSPWPETWSYTLSEALAAGLPVLALDIGAIADRVRAHRAGFLLPPDCAPRDISNALLNHFLQQEDPVVEPVKKQRQRARR